LPYAQPRPVKSSPPPVKVEMLNIELNRDSSPQVTPPKAAVAPPDPQAQPDIPQPIPVAEPSPAVAFALPVTGPMRVVDVRHAASAQAPSAHAMDVRPAAQTLVFGQGEGRQPAPEYPARARREGEQGSVTVRFTIGTDGSVLTAEAVAPSPWALLNEAALRVVRERWRFPSGPLRIYDVKIRFTLTE
jgi:protein TonB